MVSKSSAVHSLRIPNALWDWLGEEAARRKTTVNGLVCDLLLVARLKVAELKAAEVRPVKSIKDDLKPAPFKSRLKGEWKAP